MKLARFALAPAAAVAAILCQSEAQAIERQHHIGLAPALGILSIDGKSTVSAGLGGALHYAYGLSDQFNFAVEASSIVVATDQRQDAPELKRNRPATVDQLNVGALYVIDILRWVPYVGLTGGMYRLAGGTVDEDLFLPGAAAAVGLDYQINRSFAVGLAGRQHFLLSKLDDYPSYTTVMLRFELMWGY